MTRLRGVQRDEVTPEQRILWDEIVASRAGSVDVHGDDGSLSGPFNVMVRDPSLGRHWSALGRRLRFEGSLDERLLELAVCTVGAHFRCDFEFSAHAPLARAAGVDQSTLDALRRGDEPPFDRDDERVVHAIVTRLVRAEAVGGTEYEVALATVGEIGMVELASLVGYYSALAMMLNLFDVAPPRGSVPVWRAATADLPESSDLI